MFLSHYVTSGSPATSQKEKTPNKITNRLLFCAVNNDEIVRHFNKSRDSIKGFTNNRHDSVSYFRTANAMRCITC